MSHVIGGQSATTLQVAARLPIRGLVMSPPVRCPCGAHCFDQSEELLYRHPAVPYLATRIRGAKREPFRATLPIKGQHGVSNLNLDLNRGSDTPTLGCLGGVGMFRSAGRRRPAR